MLKDEVEELDKKPNYITVPVAIRELEKIELVRQTDGKYRMDHAVTETEKIILKAFDMYADQIQDKAVGLADCLKNMQKRGNNTWQDRENDIFRRADKEAGRDGIKSKRKV